MSVKRVLRLLHRERKTHVERPVSAARHIGVLGLDTRVLGNVKFVGSLTIDGTITGQVSAPENTGAVLVVGQNASVTGNIVADSVLVSGRVLGDVKAADRLEIFETGTLHGDVETGDIMIQGGAEFRGHCEMRKPQPALREAVDPHAAAAESPRESVSTPDSARKGRKGKGRHDRVDGAGHDPNSLASGLVTPEGALVQQDSRTERGGSSEGSLA